ncbi:SulP family inorganic anion transporter [Flavobacteriaceae bacterium R38]|nr:SulP family inorganic anion transporter [Flavobacteriaceae bacterium R38]
MGAKKNNIKTFIGALPKNIFSGFVVSLIALPLGLGLAIASEAPPISGVIASIIGGIVVAIFGGSNVTVTGPGNGLVIVLLSAITTLGGGDLYQGYLLTLAAVVLSGILMIILGFLRLGILSDFFPSSAIQGMLAAIGVGIFAKQFHVMVGQPGTKGSIPELLIKAPNAISVLFTSAPYETIAAALVGIISLLIMVFYSKIRNKYFQLVPAPMWIVIITIGISYYYQYMSTDAYPISKNLLVVLPDNITSSLAFPDFSKAFDISFWGTVIAITLISSIESLLSIKAVDKLDPQKRRSNVSKDLKALGLATTISGFLGGLNVVTVIARSSVNVNNGGSNRSSNFFHAFFLILFILLFQEQLKRIPLPALAAILVYTGYKLTAPENIRKISKIGKEQLFIFFITLLTTIFTNLITGISIGILITFITHVLINKSFSLFLRNFLKPNVLMFKEDDTGNYFVSVKNFCSFLNFYKLKAKLDVIPENQEVIVDFSMCDFVDHTVMDNLNAYQQTFLRRGGNFEIIGLDAHETDSTHPFAIRKIIPFQSIINIEKYLTKRQNLIKDIAKDFHWIYEPKKLKNVLFLYDFEFFKTRQIKHLYNRLYDPDKTFMIFDIEYSEGEFIAKEVVKATMLSYKLKKKIPVFTLDKEDFLNVLYQWTGHKDIDIEGHSDFSKRFFLLGEDQESIKEFFTDELILFFESNPYYHIESNGESLFIKDKDRLSGVKEIKAMIDYGARLKNIIEKQYYRSSRPV